MWFVFWSDSHGRLPKKARIATWAYYVCGPFISKETGKAPLTTHVLY